MHLQPVVSGLALLALAGRTVAAPADPKSFTIDVARRSGPTLKKRATSASAPATQHVVADFLYGTPAQKIPIAIDTGSSFSFVASTLMTSQSEIACIKTGGNPNANLFNPKTSSTFHNDTTSDYVDCSNPTGSFCPSPLGVDTVSIAGLSTNSMIFGTASDVPCGVFVSGQSGTMGFGRQPGAITSTPSPRDLPFWYRAGAALATPYLFATNLYQGKNGTIDFGALVSSRYTGSIAYGAMDLTQSNWNFQLNGYAIAIGSVQPITSTTFILDTGNPGIGLPPSIATPWFQSFGGYSDGGSGYYYPCSSYPPPTLSLRFASSGAIMVLNGTFLVNAPTSGQTTCTGSVDASSQTQYNLGAPVFDQKYVIFDYHGTRVGFANKTGSL